MQQKRTSEVRTSQQNSGQEQRIFSFKITQWVWIILGVVETLIALRVILKLIGANAASPFAALIYNISNLFLFPFEGLVGTPTSGAIVLEISSIIAMLVYLLLAWGIVKIVWVVLYRPRGGESLDSFTRTTTREPNSTVQTTTREEYSDDDLE
ncbi:MAG TPA: YggT family protein [Anaerolineae bacterium]|nr:YggT family protein [Anaerolineae bacterium]